MAISPDGYCLCGCGQQTEIWLVNNRRLGRTVGSHRPFIKGHEQRIAPDGKGYRYRDTKWCRNCQGRHQIDDFRSYTRADGRVATQAYCKTCEVAVQRERYQSSPSARRRKIASSTASRQRSRARQLADLEAKRIEDELERKNPMCLRLSEPMGLALIDEVCAYYGTAPTVESKLVWSVGGVNRYRHERYMTYDIVDRLLVFLGEPYRLDEFTFRRRSEWMASEIRA